MDVEFFGLLYLALLIVGTGAMQVVGIVLALKAWLVTQAPAPSLGVRESLLSANDEDDSEVRGGQQRARSTCEV
jgi:hypothetical protein